MLPHPGETFFITDPCSAFDPRFGQILIVSFRGVEVTEGIRRFGRSELWWLRLDEEGRTIVNSGRLVSPGSGFNAGELRSPSLSKTSGGAWALAYLQKSEGKGWDLRHASLVVEDRHPRMVDGLGAILARGCGPTSPSFSTDSRRIWYIEATQLGSSIRSIEVQTDQGNGPQASRIP